MDTKSAFFAVTLATTFTALPALAAGDACVQINRIFSTMVVDSNTILVTDLAKKQFTVHMRGVCVGFDRNSQKLSFRTKTVTELGCLSRGDSVSYNVPGENTPVTVRGSLQTPCFVDSVTEGAPSARSNSSP